MFLQVDLLQAMMDTRIQLKLSATLGQFTPADADNYPIRAGVTIRELLAALGIPRAEVNLVFVNGGKANLEARLAGGERVSIFPPLGGG